jgi:hypothetical protein
MIFNNINLSLSSMIYHYKCCRVLSPCVADASFFGVTVLGAPVPSSDVIFGFLAHYLEPGLFLCWILALISSGVFFFFGYRFN